MVKTRHMSKVAFAEMKKNRCLQVQYMEVDDVMVGKTNATLKISHDIDLSKFDDIMVMHYYRILEDQKLLWPQKGLYV